MPALIMSSSNYLEDIWFTQNIFELNELRLRDKSQEPFRKTRLMLQFGHTLFFFIQMS